MAGVSIGNGTHAIQTSEGFGFKQRDEEGLTAGRRDRVGVGGLID